MPEVAALQRWSPTEWTSQWASQWSRRGASLYSSQVLMSMEYLVFANSVRTVHEYESKFSRPTICVGIHEEEFLRAVARRLPTLL